MESLFGFTTFYCGSPPFHRSGLYLHYWFTSRSMTVYCHLCESMIVKNRVLNHLTKYIILQYLIKYENGFDSHTKNQIICKSFNKKYPFVMEQDILIREFSIITLDYFKIILWGALPKIVVFWSGQCYCYTHTTLCFACMIFTWSYARFLWPAHDRRHCNLPSLRR